MEHSRLRKPALSQSEGALPGDRAFLASVAKCTPPMPKNPLAEHPQTIEVSWYRVVVEVALHHRFEPLTGLWHGIVHARAELLPDLSQLGPHALANRRASYRESPYPVLPADMREAQKLECVGLAFTSTFPVLFSKPAELDPARFIWV